MFVANSVPAADTADAPTITRQPVTQTGKRLGKVTFEVKATGSGPLTYRWYRNGLAFPDWTRSSLTLSDITENDIGNYAVQVAGPGGSTISQAVQLRLEGSPPPAPAPAPAPAAASAQPHAGAAAETEYVEAGQPLRLAAAANGSPPFKFQWKKDGQPLAGKTQARFEIPSVRAPDAGKYICTVSNSAGSMDSPPVQIVVGKKP